MDRPIPPEATRMVLLTPMALPEMTLTVLPTPAATRMPLPNPMTVLPTPMTVLPTTTLVILTDRQTTTLTDRQTIPALWSNKVSISHKRLEWTPTLFKV